MSKHIYIGMDVHKETITLATAEGPGDGEVREYGTIANSLHALERALRNIQKPDVILHCVYEAGPCGYVIYRRLQQLKIECQVIAPSLTPRKPGERIKTDRRDARKLARLHRAGELTAIHVPDERDEAIRDLCRARTDAGCDLRGARQQLKALLLRLGYRYTGKGNWNEAHLRYLRELKFAHAAQKVVLEEYLMAVSAALERMERLDGQIGMAVQGWRMKAAVEALMAFRGMQVLTATVLVAELGDMTRFDHARALMSFLGLVASEHSSGGSRHRGSITKTGNPHARWFLVESAQHYALPAKVSKELSKRLENQPQWVKELSWKAQLRLNKKFWRLMQRGVIRQKAVVAVARELVGFIWALMKQIQPQCLEAKKNAA